MLANGAAARGKAIDMTWPNGAIVPPFVRIDHVLTGTRLTVTQIATRPGFGCDHRYLAATVQSRPEVTKFGSVNRYLQHPIPLAAAVLR